MSKHGSASLHEVFFALSDPTRVNVVQILGRGPRRASDLAKDLDASRPGMSRHVRILRAARLIREEPDPADGRARILVLDQRAFSDVADFLEELSWSWEARLGAFKALAEKRAREWQSEGRKRKSAS